MNVTINRAEMLCAIKRASAIAPADSPLDVLRGVLLEADAAAGKLTVTSTNLEAALEEERSELAVRIGYWGQDSRARVEEIVAEIRRDFPDVPIIATGGPTDETILSAIRAGANAITYTPPSSKDLFARDMQEYRDWYEAHRREVDEMLNEE